MKFLFGYLILMSWLSFITYSLSSVSNKDILHPYRDLDKDDREEKNTDIYVQDEQGFFHEVNNGYFVDSKGHFRQLNDIIGPLASDDKGEDYIKDDNIYRKL